MYEEEYNCTMYNIYDSRLLFGHLVSDFPSKLLLSSSSTLSSSC